VAGFALAISADAAAAEANKPSASTSQATFSTRKENPDGSVAMTIGRRLPTVWETKIGTDVRFAGTTSPVPSENLLKGTAPDRTTGAIWGSMTMPGFTPFGWDKTAIEGRVDAEKEQGKVGAILSRSVPLGRSLSVTVQNGYAVTRVLPGMGLATATAPIPIMPPAPTPLPSAPETSSILSTEQSVRLNINPWGTAFSAGMGTSSVDDQWHNKLSVEQTLFGPLKITTSIEDTGTAANRKTITAGFKKTW
jgi:hypothetical protein